MKNCKTISDAQTARNYSPAPPPTPRPPNQIKYYYVSGTKIFLQRYTEIYRHLLSKCFSALMK